MRKVAEVGVACIAASANTEGVAITDIDSALAQYNANLSWQTSQASAQAALEAIRFLLVNRANKMENRGHSLNYESLVTEKEAIEKFLGVTTPRAFGRSRRVGVVFTNGGGIQ